ncbi:MAG: hypothetical protein WCT03_18765 [Candidatus Obscuribacterales bacterium]|jgi:hypothetical protein
MVVNLVALLLLALMVFACFGNTLGVYFNCDDFLHLPYLYRMASGEPELLVSNFTGPWVGERSLYLFFRPLTEVSLIVDYFFNHSSALGYHLSNLIWHTANAFILFLFCQALLEKVALGTKRDQLGMAFCIACIFATFPTHSEAVAWILARADLVSTFFFMLSLYLFVASEIKRMQLLSIAAFFCALLSKETAISLPVVIFALAITLSDASGKRQKLKDALKSTAPYLVAFAIYLAWRFAAIGKLVGGYVGSIGQRLYENYYARWVSSGSLWQLLHPFNQAIFADNHILRQILRVLYALAGIFVVAGVAVDQKLSSRQKLIYFSLAFFVATMLPNFQVWGLSSSMSGSRIAYLPSAALALMLVLSIFIVLPKALPSKIGLALKTTSLIVLVALIFTFAAISNGNNIAWLNAANMIRNLKSNVESEVAALAPSQKLVLFNLPSRVDGAFTFTMRSMLAGLFIAPLSADISERIVPFDFHPNWSIFVNRQDFQSVRKQPELYKLAVYDAALDKLVTPDFKQRESGTQPLPPLSIVEGKGAKSSSFYLKPEGSAKSIDPLQVEFLELTVKVSKKPISSILPGLLPSLFSSSDKASLFIIWNNRPADQEDQTSPHWMAIPADGQVHKILVELGPQKRWLLSKNVDMIRLDVATEQYDWQISEPKLLDAKAVTPLLNTEQSDDNYALAPLSQDRKGNIKKNNSSNTKSKITFNYDASNLRGQSVLVEVSKPFASFEHYDNLMRDRSISKHALLRTRLNALKGSFTIDLDTNSNDKNAVYQVHVAALDEGEHVVGTFSDPVTIESASPAGIK